MLKSISLAGLILYFIILIIAVTREKKNQNTLDYFFGGRTLPFWALSITFIASWWGAGSALSTADLAYEDGLGAFWYYGVPVLISTFLMIIISKSIRRVGFLTQGKMMKSRYSKTTSILLSILIVIFMTFTASTQMVGIGDFFGTYLGMSYESGIFIGTGIVLIYSMFGGFRGVVLTDIIQFVLLAVSAFAVFVIAMSHAGGFEGIAKAAEIKGKTDFMSFTAGAGKYLMYVITFGCAWMIQANVWQRISAAKNNKDAKKMTIMSFFAYIPLYLIVVFTGMAGMVLFKTKPEGGIVTAVVTNYMPPVIGAIVFIGISAAIMSTMDSLINTAAMTLTLDLKKESNNHKRNLFFSRMATFGVTIIALIIALRIRSILDISRIASDIITTGLFIPLTAGFIWRRGNTTGAIASIIAGFSYSSYNFLIEFGVNLPHFWTTKSAMQIIIGIIISTASYILFSLLSKPEYEKADDFILLARKGKNS